MKKVFSCKWIFALLLVAFVAVGFSCSFFSDDDDDDDTPSNTPTTTTGSKLTAQDVEGVDGDYTIEETTYSVSGETVVTTGGEKQEVSALSSSKISFTILSDSGVSVTITIDSSGNITYTISGTTYSGTFSFDGSATLTSSSGEKIIAAKASGATINAILKSLGAQSTATSLKPSQTQPSSSAKVIIPSVNAVAWLSGTTIYYYAAGYTDSGKGIPLPADCSDMFFGCTSLEYIDMTGFDASGVTNMSWMFAQDLIDYDGTPVLSYIDLTGFDTSSATNMKEMFREFAGTTLDVSSFDTSGVTYMSAMFKYCYNLKKINGVEDFDTSNVVKIDRMFMECSSLTSLDLQKYDTSKATTMNRMFQKCESLTSLDVSSFDTSAVTDMTRMFNNCNALTKLDVSNFNTNKVTSMHRMFYGVKNVANLDVSNFSTANVTDMGGMFSHCESLEVLDLSSFDMSSVTNTQASWEDDSVDDKIHYIGMFKNCFLLKTIKVKSGSNWNALGIKDDIMFENCYSLTGGNGTLYSYEHIGSEYARVDDGTGAPGYFTAR